MAQRIKLQLTSDLVGLANTNMANCYFLRYRVLLLGVFKANNVGIRSYTLLLSIEYFSCGILWNIL